MGHPNDKRIGTKPSASDAARSVTVVIQNNSSAVLGLSQANLVEGAWSQGMYPPIEINRHSTAKFATESVGDYSGTMASVNYIAIVLSDPSKQGAVDLSWNDPYTGSNTYGNSAPYFLDIQPTGGSGNNATWTVTITDAS